MSVVRNFLSGSGLAARLMRSSTWVIAGHLLSQVIRFGSNLILTRLLFPEVFGLMALITVFIVGLQMFSDIGTGPSIQQSKRGDDEDFLNTAWSIQIVRGTVLWLASCLIALPAAWFYAEPQLAQMLPVAGLTLFVAGFNPTRIQTANRHLIVGRVTFLTLISQILGVLFAVLLAWKLKSAWALVFSGVLAEIGHLALMHFFLPGLVNRPRLERSALRELLGYGRWIFLSTLCSFLVSQGDKAILGAYLKLDSLGIYNIGFTLATFAAGLAGAVNWRLMIPLYRERPQGESRENFLALRKFRFVMTSCVFAAQLPLAFLGVWLVDVLYDERFHAAGSVVTALAAIYVIPLVTITYDPVALAAGDSKSYFFVQATKAIVQTGAFFVGIHYAGIPGALIAYTGALIAMYPLTVRLAAKHSAWDPLHDMIALVFGCGLASLALWMNRDALQLLGQFQ